MRGRERERERDRTVLQRTVLLYTLRGVRHTKLRRVPKRHVARASASARLSRTRAAREVQALRA